MDMMQSEWEPLSHCELEDRLDQAMEGILEVELMNRMQGQGQGCSQSVLTQHSKQDETLPHTAAHSVTSPTSTAAASLLGQAEGEQAEKQQHITEIEENPTVQVRL